MEERLQKILARAGVASRRKAEEYISEGRVEVNGQKVTELGAKADAARDSIRVDGKLIADIEERVYYVLFKPSGCVTTMNDPEGRTTVQDYLKQVRERVYPVGRLDYDAEGALLLTNDGELAHKLMHPKFGARRTYLAKVKGEPTARTIEKLRAGVQLEDGMAKPIEAGLVSRAEKNTWIQLTVAEGRPHLVKRLCEAVGHPVQRLFRSSYAGVTVDNMMAGELRELSSAEVRQLRSRATPKAGAPETARVGLPPRRDARRTAFKPRGVGRKPSR
jgi:23S rRNA pseudouridine2605 synthase